MPAYFIRLTERTCRDCHRKATVEVFNDRNSSCGTFCNRHGTKMLKELNRVDQKEREPSRDA